MSDDDSGDSDWTALDAFEARRATGFVKRDGKHTLSRGNTSRLGYQRIEPAENGHDLLDVEADELAKLAKETLGGRNLSVFQGHVLNPTEGKRKLSVDELAAQYGVTPARIHKILYDCKAKIRAEHAAKQRDAVARERPSSTCSLCGREFRYGSWPTMRGTCKAIYGTRRPHLD